MRRALLVLVVALSPIFIAGIYARLRRLEKEAHAGR
jgi:hypothetical protein